jgi:hypothetical protein
VKALPIGIALALSVAHIPALMAQEAKSDPGIYQIIKAENDRVWRLNRETGEIAVCTLLGEMLSCTTSTEAVRPKARTLAEREAELNANLAFMDKVFESLKGLIRAGMDRDRETAAAQTGRNEK